MVVRLALSRLLMGHSCESTGPSRRARSLPALAYRGEMEEWVTARYWKTNIFYNLRSQSLCTAIPCLSPPTSRTI